jgi:hypothetical protein
MGGGRVSLASLFRMILLTAIAALAVGYGLRLREWAFHATQGVHFEGDIRNGWAWGAQAIDRGLFNFYSDLEDSIAAGEPARKNDYPPLRLSVMTAWTYWSQQKYPMAQGWVDNYEFTAPVLHVNTAAELSSAVLVFCIIFVLKRQMNGAWTWQAATAGVFGGLLFWFNPAVIWDSHCWPQWDVWCLPFFFAAILAACLNGWFVAGGLILVGSFFKGQLLLVAPIFLLWPLFRFDFGALLRFVCGFIFTAAVVAAPWMNLQKTHWVWLIAVAVAMLLLWVPRFVLQPGQPEPHRRRISLILTAIPVAMLLAWPWTSAAPLSMRLLAWLPLLVVFIATIGRRFRWPLAALACAIAVLLTMPLLNASTSWFTLGFVYGTQKFDNMFTGNGSWNVPKMLVEYLGWRQQQDPDNPNNVVRLWLIGKTISVHTMMRGLYFSTLILCGIGAAIQHYRRDTRLLVALATPWLTMFLLLPQMHGRYSIWAAGACALLAGESVGLALLGLIVSVVAALGIMENQMLFRPDWWPDLLNLLQRVDPHPGWVLVLSAVIFLYVALLPRLHGRLARRAEAEAVLQRQEVVEVH